MALVAVVISDSAAGTSMLAVGGIGIVQRQCREARIAGAKRVLVLVDGLDPALDAEQVEQFSSAPALAARLAPDDVVLMLGTGLVVDERIVGAIVAAPVPAVACWPQMVPPRGIERIDPTRLSAGVAVYRGAMVIDVANGLGDWDLASTLLRTALADPQVTMVDLAALPTYATARRRDVPFIWSLPNDTASARHATDIVIESAQKGCLDWPARLVHPP
ncbi:MAG: hypothetical protein ACRCUI_04300, partial [Polymorphobacter sp.]